VFTSIASTIEKELSGARAKQQVIEIHRTDRYSSFDLYRQTAAYCRAQMEAIGLADVETVSCRADGRTPYGDWLIPRAWDARSGQLVVAETGHVLAAYPDDTAALSMYSAATPEEGIETELVWVDRVEDLPESFSGKMIFCSSAIGKRERDRLAKQGIRGIAFSRGKIDMVNFPDQRAWDNYMLAPRNEEGMFGFSLSHREATYLRNLCANGPVKVRAHVDTTLYDGVSENVTGVIRGSEENEEVLMLAHLYEQGANDNASGAAMSLEVFRALNRLIDAGHLPRPRRTMRILLGFECCGFMGYVVNRMDRMHRTVAAINPDMVGEDQELCGSSFGLHLTPGADPSCVDALAIRLMEDVAASGDPLLRWRTQPYGVCDSFVADPTIGVPSVSIIGIPDRFYHSSMDTPDKVSPATLDKTGLVLATYLYFLANAGPKEAAWLAEEAAAQGKAQIAQMGGAFARDLNDGNASEIVANASDRLRFLAERHGRAVASSSRFGEAGGAKVDRLKAELADAAASAISSVKSAASESGDVVKIADDHRNDLQERAARITPRRLVVGPLTLEPLLLKSSGPFRYDPHWCAPYDDFLMWADGDRSILEIYRCAQLEAGRTAGDLAILVDYFEFLAEHDYVSFNETS